MSADPPVPVVRATGSLRRQLVLLSAGVTALAAVLLTLLVQLVLARTTSRSVERVLEERTDAVISSAQSVSTGSRLVVPDADLDAGVAVYDASGAVVAGAVPSSMAELYAGLVAEGAVRTVDASDDHRVRVEPFTLDSGVRGTVVVEERTAPYEGAETAALVVSAATGLLAVLASALLAAWVSRRALAPVVAMASTAGAWSEQDLARRFDLGPPTNEITALGGTLDALLDKVTAAILSEQRLTSELAHELRTPLTAVQGTADLMLLRPGLGDDLREDVDEIRAGTHRMAETVSGLLDLARSTSGGAEGALARLRPALDHVVASHAGGVDCVVDVPDDVVVALPAALVERSVAPVVENAARVAAHVRISLLPARPGFVAVAVDDDGPGVPTDARELVFEPGRTFGDHQGSGLGLPLARRIARSVGGDVRHEPREAGSRFVVELPRA